MGNCMAPDNRVVSREGDNNDYSRTLLREEEEGAYSASKQGGCGGPIEEEKKKRKMEKKVRFKLEDGDKEGVRGEKRGDFGNGKRGARRVKVVVTKEELRWILECVEQSSRCNSSSSSSSCLEELMMRLSSSRSDEEGRRVGINGGGKYWRPGLESIHEHLLVYNSN